MKEDNIRYNRKSRRYHIKDILKSEEPDSSNIIEEKNKYRQILKTEKGNFKKWMERLKKTQEMGKQIQKVNKEEEYNERVKKKKKDSLNNDTNN